jgi:hypothetical protein
LIHQKEKEMKKGFYVQKESLSVGGSDGEHFRINFFKAVVIVLISLFIVVAVKAQAPVSPDLSGQGAVDIPATR